MSLAIWAQSKLQITKNTAKKLIKIKIKITLVNVSQIVIKPYLMIMISAEGAQSKPSLQRQLIIAFLYVGSQISYFINLIFEFNLTCGTLYANRQSIPQDNTSIIRRPFVEVSNQVW